MNMCKCVMGAHVLYWT